MGNENCCATNEQVNIDEEWKQNGQNQHGFNNADKEEKKLTKNPYTQGGAKLINSSLLQSSQSYPKTTLKDQNNIVDHKPSSVVAEKVEQMNPLSDKAKSKEISLPEFIHKKDLTIASHPFHGPYRYKNGDTYKGQYFRGQRKGYGELVTTSGEQYVGQFDYDQCSGVGRLILPNGDYYEGEFLAGRANGRGRFISEETGISYEGQFKDDMQEGKGKETYPDGSYYYGEFVGKFWCFFLTYSRQKTRNRVIHFRRWRKVQWKICPR